MTLPLVLGITGQARAGKDTLARFFVERHGYRRKSFADPVRSAALALDPIVKISQAGTQRVPYPVRLSDVVENVGWERAKDEYPEVRRTLQRLGTEVGRGLLGENVWVDQAGPWPQEVPTVFADCRFDNEAVAIVQSRGVVLEVIRHERRSDTPSHASEAGINRGLVRGIIFNDGTPEQMYSQAMSLLRARARV